MKFYTLYFSAEPKRNVGENPSFLPIPRLWGGVAEGGGGIWRWQLWCTVYSAGMTQELYFCPGQPIVARCFNRPLSSLTSTPRTRYIGLLALLHCHDAEQSLPHGQWSPTHIKDVKCQTWALKQTRHETKVWWSSCFENKIVLTGLQSILQIFVLPFPRVNKTYWPFSMSLHSFAKSHFIYFLKKENNTNWW